MDDIFVGRLMSSPVRTVTPDTPAHVAAETMLDHDIGSVVVVEEGRLEGILTATDFVHVAAEQRWAADATVATYMTTDVVTTTANDSIADVADVMLERGFQHVPVVDADDNVVGMLSATDLTAYLSEM
ncbi:CBS domain-containing protein [Halorussus amylolyticus]|uniref:CBS domain-containing protein n=1 Tax=Halorussus amylolyticus TaxID=1126242 RepID=UPI00104D66D5|nr:CBS domain-containing protein [Halorussus amylolyticus]